MGNLEVNSDALTFPLDESVHNGYLEFENVHFACPTVVKGRLGKKLFYFGRTLGLAGGCCVSFKKAIAYHLFPFLKRPFSGTIPMLSKIMFLFALTF